MKTKIPVTVSSPSGDASWFRRPLAVLTEHIAAGTAPAVCAAVTSRDRTIALAAAGRHTYAEDAQICRPGDLFDLASVTKVMATATLFAILVDRGTIDPNRPVRDWIPEGPHDRRVTPKALLAHCGGLPAHVHLYRRMIDRDEVVRAVCGMALEYEPLTQTVYSDMGFILLGEVLERATSRPINELFRDRIREPLGLHETVYCPGPTARERIVPTEDDTRWRGRLVHGEVHDENASVMGGVAPHAGLFSTAENVARFVRLWLNEGTLDGKRLFSAETARRFRSRVSLDANSTWAMGWDTVSPGASTSGRHFSAESYGSLGFTGTSVWVDPVREIGVVLLTNRVHPTRENDGIKTLRPAFHDAVMENVAI